MSMRIIDKLFFDDAYGCAINSNNDTDDTYYVKRPTVNSWFADPFIVSNKGKSFVFVEYMSYLRNLGSIAVAPVENNRIGCFKEIIKEPFHMSFPNVFEYNGYFYMIPETFKSKQLRLYKCLDFPYNWKFQTTIANGVEYVDSIIFIEGDDALIISYDISDSLNPKLVAGDYNFITGAYIPIELSGNHSLDRPGGSFFEDLGGIYRVTQDCRACYGDYLHLLKVDSINMRSLEDHEIRELHFSDFSFDNCKGIKHVHTLNSNAEYKIVDFRARCFYPHKLLQRLWTKITNRQLL